MSFDAHWEPPLPFIKNSGQNKIYQCPRCWRNNFWWHMAKQGGRCWSCHCHFSQRGLYAELGLEWVKGGVQLSNPTQPQAPAAKPLQIQPVIKYKKGDIPLEARAFLMGDKGLLEEELRHLSWQPLTNSVYVGLCPRRGDGMEMAWMERPVSSDGHWNYIEGDLNGYKYTKKDFYYSTDPKGAVHPTKVNILVEGVFDAIRLHNACPLVNPIACLGTKMSPTLLRQFITTYPTGPTLIWFDPDRAGREGHNALAHAIQYALGFNSVIVRHPSEPADCGIMECRRVVVEHAKVLIC